MAEKQLIVVFDNVRNYAQVESLLPGAPRSLVLVTSRRRLFELAQVVSALDVLPLEYAADLFVRLSNHEPSTLPRDKVERICRLCGALPLAVSLLAARFRFRSSWTIDDLLTRLTQGGAAQVSRFLSGEGGLDTVLDLSFDELPLTRRSFFLRLGAFPGTDVDANLAAVLAQVDISDAVEELESLHEEHLLEETSVGRFRFHDLVRAYVAKRMYADLPDEEILAATERVEALTLRRAGQADLLIGRVPPVPASASVSDPGELDDRVGALRWFERNRGNLLAVLEAAEDRQAHAVVVRLSAAIAGFLQHAGPWDQAEKIQEAAIRSAAALGDDAAKGRAQARLGLLYRLTSRYDLAREELERASELLARAGRPADESFALNHLGIVEFLVSHYEVAENCQRRALQAAEIGQDDLARAGALHDLGMVLRVAGRDEESEARQSEALSIFRRLGDVYGQANALRDLGLVSAVQGEYEEAENRQQASLRLYQQLGDRLHQGYALNEYGTVRRIRGDLTVARQAHAEAQEIYGELGDRYGEANALRLLGVVERMEGKLPSALARLHSANEIYASVDSSAGVAIAQRELASTTHLLGRSSEAWKLFASALEGHRKVGDRLNEAETLDAWGLSLYADGEYAEAQRRFEESFLLADRLGATLEVTRSREGLALCAGRAGLCGEAVELLGQCVNAYRVMGLADNADRAESRRAQFISSAGEGVDEPRSP